MPNFTVRQGDTTAGIAFRNGLIWETIWEHPNNAQLRASRDNKNILKPGDVLFIPERSQGEESCSTDQRHRFRRKGVPERFRLRFVEDPQQIMEGGGDTEEGAGDSGAQEQEKDVPRADVSYLFEIDGQITNGTTDQDGWIEYSIPPDVQSGRIILNPSTPQEEEYRLQVGHLNPISELSGVKHRLQNLGLFEGEIDDQPTPELETALRTFQERHNLTVSGEPDQPTRDKLVEVHGS